MIKDQKGMTLVELVVAMAILGLIFVSMMNVFDISVQLGYKLSAQSLTQLNAQDTLNQMIDGFTYNHESISGIRSALDINNDRAHSAVGYLTNSKNVSYYLNESDSSLYRVVTDPDLSGVAVANTTGGSVVLRYVKTFSISPDGHLPDGGLLDITLETEKGSGVSKNGIKLITSVFSRN
ncbi:MAG: prepilin-type N-terminal cleavage/methylation domain-containing protein [Bacillota bacterium]